MQELLELLGLVEAPTGRREPVALPAWTRMTLPVLVVVLTIVSVLLFALFRWLVA